MICVSGTAVERFYQRGNALNAIRTSERGLHRRRYVSGTNVKAYGDIVCRNIERLRRCGVGSNGKRSLRSCERYAVI